MAKQAAMKEGGHGEYVEITIEKEFLQISTKTKKVVCHFYHPDFTRCKIVDKHLQVFHSISKIPFINTFSQ